MVLSPITAQVIDKHIVIDYAIKDIRQHCISRAVARGGGGCENPPEVFRK